MHMNFSFPFGQPLHTVAQTDRSPKSTFVLGVYGGAVHACWTDARGKVLVKALAVASEPEIYWTGEEAAITPEHIINTIPVPEGAGALGPAAPFYNGVAGRTLDSHILVPLGLSRSDVWLCDCVPHSCVNNAQRKALKREYFGRIVEFALPKPTVPTVPELAGEQRHAEILAEFNESGATRLILLGDQPINWFLRHVVDEWEWYDFHDFVDDKGYGAVVSKQIAGRTVDILPLAHTRQIVQPGSADSIWYDLHEAWMQP
jgi:hypothetical protein